MQLVDPRHQVGEHRVGHRTTRHHHRGSSTPILGRPPPLGAAAELTSIALNAGSAVSPVKTMATPSSSALAMLSSSLTEPPGWMIDRDTGVGRGLDAVGERVEGVARAGAALGPAGRLGRGDLARLDPVLLAGADAPRGAVLDQDDRVALHPADQAPRQLGVGPLGLGRLRAW